MHGYLGGEKRRIASFPIRNHFVSVRVVTVTVMVVGVAVDDVMVMLDTMVAYIQWRMSMRSVVLFSWQDVLFLVSPPNMLVIRHPIGYVQYDYDPIDVVIQLSESVMSTASIGLGGSCDQFELPLVYKYLSSPLNEFHVAT